MSHSGSSLFVPKRTVWFFTLKPRCGRVHYNRSRHLCSQFNIQWPCCCILSFHYLLFLILLWLFSFTSSLFQLFIIFLVLFLVLFWYSSPWFLSFPPISLLLLYTAYLVLFLYSFPCSHLQASLTQCVSILHFALISLHPSSRESCMPIRSLCHLSSSLSPAYDLCVCVRARARACVRPPFKF